MYPTNFNMMKNIITLLIVFILTTLCTYQNGDDIADEIKNIVLDEKSVQLVEAGNEFGLDLFQNIYAAETKAENILVSPLSVSLALAMTYNGASGETKTAMEKTLKVYGLHPDDINLSYKNLVAALQSLDAKVILEIANAIYYSQEFQVENDFISRNKKYYDAEIQELDFGSPGAVETINAWVADKTHHKIETILDFISPSQVMFLLNAIYFKGIWQSEFDKEKTVERPFNPEKGGTENALFMSKTDTVSYFSNDLFSAVKLPYGMGNYNMQIFLPHQDKVIQNIIDELNRNSWNTWQNSFQDPVQVQLQIPKLKYAYEIKLNDVLSDMGMNIAFGGGADFSGINNAGGLFIDYVKHKTFIEVNEEGTEAAAVTIVAIDRGSSGPVPIRFDADRPFFYAITEADTQAILFMGTINNPNNEG